MAKQQKRLDRIAVLGINTVSVLLIVLLLCGLFYAAKPRAFLKNDTTLTYTVTFRAIRPEYTADIRKGDTVLDAVGKREIGQVLSYTVSPAMTEVYNRRENCLRVVEHPGRVTLTLCVQTDARHEGMGYTIAGFPLFGGKEIPLRLRNFVGTGICTDICETTKD